MYSKYILNKKRNNKNYYSCFKCKNIEKEKTCLSKYGVVSYSMTDEFKKSESEKWKGKIKGVEHANTFIPAEIQKLVETGELIQWRKHPHTFFVAGVDKARIVWDEKRKVVAHKFVSEITVQEQRTKFVRIYNQLNALLNGR